MNRRTRNTFFGFALCLTVAVLYSCKANAYFDTGNKMLSECQNTDSFSVGDCLGMIVGHYDMMMAEGYDCGLDTVKNKRQMRDVVVKYLVDNPAERHRPAAVLSFLAFVTSFGCKPPALSERIK